MRWWFSVRGLEHPEGIAFAAAISTYVTDLDQQIMQAEAAVARVQANARARECPSGQDGLKRQTHNAYTVMRNGH